MTIIAILMSTVYGLIGLNALFMFIGTWVSMCRQVSTYCALFMCMFQLAIQIAVGALLFTKYNAVCMRSVYPTLTTMKWTMSDDFAMTITLWIFSFFTMCCFTCCGLCGAMKTMKN